MHGCLLATEANAQGLMHQTLYIEVADRPVGGVTLTAKPLIVL